MWLGLLEQHHLYILFPKGGSKFKNFLLVLRDHQALCYFVNIIIVRVPSSFVSTNYLGRTNNSIINKKRGIFLKLFLTLQLIVMNLKNSQLIQ